MTNQIATVPTPETASVVPTQSADQADPRAKSFWHYLGLCLSGAILLLVIALAVLVIVIPQLSGATPLTVLTSSMQPHLPPGTLVIVRPVNTDNLRNGDIVTYQIRSGEPELITHRITAINSLSDESRTFVVKGDNNSLPDADAVLPEQIQGQLWYSVPLIGYLNNVVTGAHRAWIIPLAAVGLLGYATYMFFSGLRARRTKRRATFYR